MAKFDRLLQSPSLALENAMAGDAGGVVRSFLAPTSLSPEQQTRMKEDMGIAGSPYEPVFNALKNPALWLTAALSLKFPVASAKNMFKFADEVGGYASKFPVLGKLLSVQSLFRGTGVADDLNQVVRDVMDYKSKYGSRIGKLLEEYETATGALPNRREQVMLSSWLDGLHKADKVWIGKKAADYVKVAGKEYETPGALMPGLEEAMSPSLRKLAEGTREVLNDQWTEIYGKPGNVRKIVAALSRYQKGPMDAERLEQIENAVLSGGALDNYFPHRQLKTLDDFEQMLQSLIKPGSKKYGESAVAASQTRADTSNLFRKSLMAPAQEDLALVEDLVDTASMGRMQEIRKAAMLSKLERAAEAGKIGKDIPGKVRSMPLEEFKSWKGAGLSEAEQNYIVETRSLYGREYSLKFSPTISQYMHSQASTYAWVTRDGGTKMYRHLDEYRKLKNEGVADAARRMEMLENTYIPIALGRGTFKMALRAQSWDQAMLKLADSVDTPAVKNLLGPDLHGWMQTSMKESRGAFNFLNLSRKAAGYFYVSTLGGNVGSAFNNIMQLVLTTGPTVGYKTAAQGIASAMKKSNGYFDARLARGLGHDEAMRFAFPEFAEEGLVGSPITDELLQRSLQEAYGLASVPAKGLVKTSEKVSRALMHVFSSAEIGNRLSTFEAGMIHAGRDGLTGKAASEYARKVVETTQFLGGPVNAPAFLLEASPIVRQLAMFPAKMFEYATGTALTLGSGAQATKGITVPGTKLVLGKGYNPGTLARAIKGSIIAQEVGNYLNIDLSDALISGALPTAQGGEKPFGIIPIVPPAFQLMGDAILSATKQDSKYIRKDLPLLIPGGVALTRLLGVSGIDAGQQFAAFTNKTYADYKNPTPDGFYPVYTGEGKLKGYFSGWDIFKMGLGIRSPLQSKEEDLVRSLVANRERILESKKGYLEARFQNQPTEAAQIASTFKKDYGFELPIKKTDWEAFTMRRRITRIESVIKTMPEGPAREEMVQLVMTSLGAQAQNLIGVDPTLLTGSPRQIEQGRVRGSGRIPQSAGTAGRGGDKAMSPASTPGGGLSALP